MCAPNFYSWLPLFYCWQCNCFTRRSVLRRSAVEKLIHRELEQTRVSEESETKAMMRSHGHFHHQHQGSKKSLRHHIEFIHEGQRKKEQCQICDAEFHIKFCAIVIKLKRFFKHLALSSSHFCCFYYPLKHFFPFFIKLLFEYLA